MKDDSLYWIVAIVTMLVVALSLSTMATVILLQPEKQEVISAMYPDLSNESSRPVNGFSITPTVTAKETMQTTTSETWAFGGYAVGKNAGNEDALMVAMSEVVRLSDGRYRMYYGWAGRQGGTGIKSAVSSDGKTWKAESGFRLQGASSQTDREAVISGPSIVKLSDGRVRMYYQSSPMSKPNESPKYHVRSALSSDGINFTREGVRIEIADYGGQLKMAGHGSYFVNRDGTTVGIFSGNIEDEKKPSDLVMATSKDGLTFGNFKKLYISWHDPIVLKTNDGYRIYATYLLEKQGTAVSKDGLTWPAMTDIIFQDQSGKKLTEGNSGVGDLGGVVKGDGSITMYANWGSQRMSEDIVYFDKK